MGGSSDSFNESPSVEITGQIMVVAIIILFVVVVFVLFLHLYAKWFWWRIERPPTPRYHRHRRRLVFAPVSDPAFSVRTGLDTAVLSSIPVLIFTPENFKDGLECAVCLSELVQGEKARVLPKCNHGFHVDCIDMWFQSHSTCPLCRNPVALECSSSNAMVVESGEEIGSQSSQRHSASGYSSDTPDFPTNVLFWGNETQLSTGAASSSESESSSSTALSNSRHGETLVIDIPVTRGEHLSSLSPTTGCPEEESKSPMTARLRSFKRLLSREKRVNVNPSSSSGTSCDV